MTEYEPSRRATLKGLSPSAPFNISFVFEPIDGGTLVNVDSTFNLKGVMRVIGPIFIGRYERGWERGLGNLKQLMEADEL